MGKSGTSIRPKKGKNKFMVNRMKRVKSSFITSAEKENWIEPMNRSARREAKKRMGFDKIPEPKLMPIVRP